MCYCRSRREDTGSSGRWEEPEAISPVKKGPGWQTSPPGARAPAAAGGAGTERVTTINRNPVSLRGPLPSPLCLTAQPHLGWMLPKLPSNATLHSDVMILGPKVPHTPVSLEGNTEGSGPTSSEPLLESLQGLRDLT